MKEPYCRDKAGDIVCGNCDAGIGDEVEYAKREGMISAIKMALGEVEAARRDGGTLSEVKSALRMALIDLEKEG